MDQINWDWYHDRIKDWLIQEDELPIKNLSREQINEIALWLVIRILERKC